VCCWGSRGHFGKPTQEPGLQIAAHGQGRAVELLPGPWGQPGCIPALLSSYPPCSSRIICFSPVENFSWLLKWASRSGSSLFPWFLSQMWVCYLVFPLRCLLFFLEQNFAGISVPSSQFSQHICSPKISSLLVGEILWQGNKRMKDYRFTEMKVNDIYIKDLTKMCFFDRPVNLLPKAF